MTESPDNFLPPLPPGLDEVDLLAWVEGDPLPRNREVSVSRFLADNPALARQLEAMRRDRDSLRALSSADRAPAGLMDVVQAALEPLLERQMLLGLQEGTPWGGVDDRPPVSMVIPVRRTVFDVLFREPAGRRMAAAAGLLLLIGGTTYFAASMFSAAPTNPLQPREIGPLARSSPENLRTDEASGGGVAIADAPGPIVGGAGDEASGATTLAQAPDTAPSPSPTLAPSLGETPESAAGSRGAGATALALSDAPGEARTTLSTADALRLAEGNRLVIRVRLGEGLARMEPVVDRLRRNSPGWRYTGEAPMALASMLIPPAPAPGGEPALVRPGEAFAASDLRGAPSAAWYGPPPPRAFFDLPRSRTTVYLVQSRLDAPSLESLRTALAGVAGEVWFEELDDAATLQTEPLPSLAPSAVLWWGQPPASWTWWSSLPVVVEPGR
jgi:anti-sigma factor RsiW